MENLGLPVATGASMYPVPHSTQLIDADTIDDDDDHVAKRKFGQYLEHSLETGDKMMAMMEKEDTPDVKDCLAVIDAMVEDGLLEDCSPMWCFAVSLNKSECNRSIFVNLSTNAKRLAWLKWEFAHSVA